MAPNCFILSRSCFCLGRMVNGTFLGGLMTGLTSGLIPILCFPSSSPKPSNRSLNSSRIELSVVTSAVSTVLTNLRSSAPKKRPMIFSQKIKSADFYFSSKGSQILFQNVFILIQFCFFPKISTHDVVWSVGTQISPKISPFEIPSEFIIATQNNKKKITQE